MPEFVSFTYREFYDVPRLIVLDCLGQRLLLDSAFDEATDEYSEFYTVLLLPVDVRIPRTGSWEHLSSEALRKLGTVKVTEIAFDDTRRRALDPTPLVRLLAQHSEG